MITRSDYWNDILVSHPAWVCSEDSFINVALVTLVGPLCLLLRACLIPVHKFNDRISIFFLDCICFLPPITLAFTILSSSLVPVNTGLALTATLCFMKKKGLQWPQLDDVYPLKGYGVPYLNTYRALVNLCTIIVILAVDFSQIFPQRLHKRYTKGYSLMDTGVGLFIFSHAIVAPESRYGSISLSRLNRVRKALVSSSMLIVLGCARLFVTWITNYSVSEEEYGKHWNFFFTLASIKLLTTIIFCVLPSSTKNFSWIVASVVGVGYQCLLSVFGYKNWIVLGDDGNGGYTGNFFNSNRPGLYSSLGYCSLYLFGVQIGRAIFLREKTLWRDQVKHLINHLLIIITSGTITWLLDTYVDRSSRMMANLTFVFWQITHNVFLLFCSHVAELVCALFHSEEKPLIPGQCSRCSKRQEVSSCCCLLSAINKNQLFFFLIGNVLTGLVNISMKTGSVANITALAVILIYGIVVCGGTCSLFAFNISTKFW